MSFHVYRRIVTKPTRHTGELPSLFWPSVVPEGRLLSELNTSALVIVPFCWSKPLSDHLDLKFFLLFLWGLQNFVDLKPSFGMMFYVLRERIQASFDTCCFCWNAKRESQKATVSISSATFWLAALRSWETLLIPCHRILWTTWLKFTSCTEWTRPAQVSVLEEVLTAACPPCMRSQVQIPQRRLCPASASATVVLASQPVKCERPDWVGRWITGHWLLSVTDGFYSKLLRAITFTFHHGVILGVNAPV